jgi:hypothetical protein
MKTVAGTVKAGHLLSTTEYLEVLGASNGRLSVKNIDTGLDFTINGAALINECSSADVEFKNEKLSLTKVAELLAGSFNVIFTVCFMKKDKTERLLRGRLVKAEPILGRSHVLDLDAKGNKNRLVDHRTIKWLRVNGVKYTVK